MCAATLQVRMSDLWSRIRSAMPARPGNEVLAVWAAQDAAPYLYKAGRLPWKVSRWVFYLTAVFEGCVSCGAVFGFATMSVVLRNEGFFRQLCESGVSECAAQTVALNAVYNVGAICSFTAPIVIGMVNDRAGARAALELTVGIAALASVFIILAHVYRADSLLYAGFACLGISSSAQMLPLYSVSNVFPGREGLGLAVLNGAVDAGSVVFLVMFYLHSAGIGFETIWIAYLCGPILLLWLSAVLLSRPVPFLDIAAHVRLAELGSTATRSEGKQPYQQQHAPATAKVAPLPPSDAVVVADREADPDPMAVYAPDSDGTLDAANPVSRPPPRVEVPAINIDSGSKSASDPAASRANSTPVAGAGPALSGRGTGRNTPGGTLRTVRLAVEAMQQAARAKQQGGASARQGHLPSNATPLDTPGGNSPRTPQPGTPTQADDAELPVGRWADRVARLQARALFGQLFTREWVGFTCFFSACILRYNAFLGGVDAHLTSLGQAGSEYTNIVGIILPLGFFVQFIVGPVLDRLGVVTAIWCLWALGVLLSILAVIPHLQLQIFTAIVFAFFRGFVFSVMTAYMSRLFGFRNYGGIVGGMMLVSGSIAMLSSPLLVWGFSAGEAKGSSKGDFTFPNATLLAIMIVAGLFPAWYTTHARRVQEQTAAKRAVQRQALRQVIQDAASPKYSAPPVATGSAGATSPTVTASAAGSKPASGQQPPVVIVEKSAPRTESPSGAAPAAPALPVSASPTMQAPKPAWADAPARILGDETQVRLENSV